ncbi:MAG: TetR-like C-terminal domain-containing protein [Dehalococcoidia bacterium]
MSRRGRPIDPALAGRICQAALDELALCGIAGVSIDRVAARARASKASVYSRWSSKEELLYDVFREFAQPMDDVDTGTLLGDLMAVHRHFRCIAGGHDPTVILAQLRAAAAFDEGLAAVLNDYMGAARAVVDGALGRAVTRAELPPDTDLHRAGEILFAMPLYRAATMTPALSESEATQLIAMVVRGFGARTHSAA